MVLMNKRKCVTEICKRAGGVYLPEDFDEISFNSLVKVYKEGKMMICRVFNDNECIAIIPRIPKKNMARLSRTVDEVFEEGECIFFKNNSCELQNNGILPHCGQELQCHDFEEIRIHLEARACMEWLPYMGLLQEVFLYLVSVESNVKKRIDHLQCEICGGSCCKKCGCYFAPTDFKNLTLPVMRKILDKGFISFIEMSPEKTGLQENVLVLKVRDTGAEIYDHMDRKTGGCIMLESTGCPFEDEDRPYGGRALVPELLFGKGCCIGYSSRQCAEDWMPYQDLLKQLANEYDGKDFEYEGIC